MAANDTLPSLAEIQKVAEDALRGVLDPNGQGKANTRAGSDNAALVSLTIQTALRCLSYAADRRAAAITQSSSGSDLDDNLRDIYGDKRQPAAQAVGHLYLVRTGTAATLLPGGSRYGVQPGGPQGAVQFQQAQLVNGVLSPVDVPVAAGVLKAAIPITCVSPGVVGNVALALVTSILDPLPDATWQLYVPIAGDPVLNGAATPDVIGGGIEAETDDQAKARVLARPAIPQPATKPGVIKGATDVPGVASAVAIEVGDGTGVLYAGDPSYQLPATIQQAVITNLENWRTYGVPTPVRAFNAVTVQVTAAVYMEQPLKAYDRAALLAAATAAVTRYFTTERIHPDEYFLDAIRTAIAKANPGTQSVVLTSPVATVLRPADAAYGALTALNRYQVIPASISIQFYDPLTS